MSSSKQIVKPTANLAMINNEENTFRVLQQTLYPGSTDAEVAMILDYCKARRIDPILKPVHLVQMDVKTDKKDSKGKYIYEKKNVIMPGIGLYRIDASRSGQYAGMSEPEFGEDITEEFVHESTKRKVTYPKWCKITVKKILQTGEIAEFTAKEYWKENFKPKSNWDSSPNTMWEKRAYGQLAKCTEAQVLRKAFPDIVGNEYTKEEMEGIPLQYEEPKKVTYESKAEIVDVIEAKHDVEQDIMDLAWADSLENLSAIYKPIYKYWLALKDKESLQQIIAAKDKRKAELEADSIEVDSETGEVIDV